jgi:autoinducer 2-degrading protein
MIVRIIDVYVHDKDIEAFKTATVKNHEGTIQEPGALRFDVLQDEADPTHFILYEVYRDDQATLDHKETNHYQQWRNTVADMMARPRSSVACSPLAPVDPAAWASLGVEG